MFEEIEWSAIISKLLELTSSGKVVWSWSDFPESLLIAEVGGIRYLVGSVDGDDRPPFLFSVVRVAGEKVLGELESIPGKSDDPWVDLSAAQMVTALHKAALRSASGVDAQFKQIMNDLEQLASIFRVAGAGRCDGLRITVCG